ncbi:hypothetical protein MO973_04710 [Paenibacillus sp. TRM 82003]|nr:hypothetical protein [Paenibacillus sp. TRM 82003]
MSVHTISIVAIRLFALYLLIDGAGRGFALLGFAVPGLPIDRTSLSSILSSSAIPAAVQLAAGALCWIGSPTLAKLAVSGSDAAEASPVGSDVRAWTAAALFVVGAATTLLALPGLAFALYSLYKPSMEGYELSLYQRNQLEASFIGVLVRMAVGSILALGAWRWAGGWMRLGARKGRA